MRFRSVLPACSLLLAAILTQPLAAADPKKTENARPSSSGSLSASGAEKDYLKLKEEPEGEEGPMFLGLGVSLGPGRRVAGRVTFDRGKAASGGLVYAAASCGPQDATAVRMSEAVLTSGGALGFAAAAGRRDSVPVIVVDPAQWGQGSERSLTLRRTVFGGPSSIRGFPVRLARKTEPFTIKEGDVVVLDPASGTLWVPAPESGKLYLDASAALRAFDGLKDSQALAQWVDAEAADLSPALRVELARHLVSEMAGRAGGAAGVQDLSKVRSALERMVGPDGTRELRVVEKKVLSRQVRAALAFFDDAAGELPGASAAWAERLCREAEGRWERVSLLAGEFKLAEQESARGRWRRLDAACGKKRASPAKSRSLADLLKAAGLRSPRTARVPADLYRRFLSETGLEPRVAALADDVSQPIARRSERIRALIRAADLPDGLSREVAACVPPGGAWAFMVPVAGAVALQAKDPSTVKEYWASLWTPGRLAQRRREGRPVKDEEAGVELVLMDPCRSSAVALSRDPSSGRPRMAVSAGYGELEGVLSGRASPDQYTLGPDGREVLPAVVGFKQVRLERDSRGGIVEKPVPPELASRRVLGPDQLAKLAAASRALEGHYGWGVEVSACFGAEGLTVLGSSPIDRLLSADQSGR